MNYFTVNSRSANMSKNIIINFLSKGINIGMNLLLVPLTINYINPKYYGVWLTITSIVGWLNVLDIGLSNGLRNKLTEALSKNNVNMGKTYIANTYTMLAIILSLIVIVFLLLNRYIPWWKILNIDQDETGLIRKVIGIVFAGFCFQYFLKPIHAILFANQRNAWVSLLITFGTTVSFLAILISKYFSISNNHIITIAIILSFTPGIVSLFATIFLFSTSFKIIKPGIFDINFKYFKDIMRLGIGFFVIQISFVVLFSTNNILITQWFGPKEVTTYNIAFKLFTTVTVIQNIVISPYWSAFTDAYVREDWYWINSAIKKLKINTFILSLCTVMILPFTSWIFDLWLGNAIVVPIRICVLLSIYVITNMYCTIYTNFINGTGKIKLQTIFSWISMLMHIPITYLVVKMYGFGLEGIILVNILWNVIGYSLWLRQYRGFMSDKILHSIKF